MIVANLYPFAQTVAAGADFETCVENIDIGGPAMIRAGAKNHHMSVLLLTLQIIMRSLWPLKLMVQLMLNETTAGPKAFQQTAAYDQMIADWLTQQTQKTKPEQAEHS